MSGSPFEAGTISFKSSIVPYLRRRVDSRIISAARLAMNRLTDRDERHDNGYRSACFLGGWKPDACTGIDVETNQFGGSSFWRRGSSHTDTVHVFTPRTQAPQTAEAPVERDSRTGGTS
jgi:hypothetical protein